VAAFVSSVIVLIVGIAICMFVARRRPPGTPLTWGEALVAATFITGMMLLAYGVIPNAWLHYAQDELKWRADAYGIPLIGHTFFKSGITFFGHGRILIAKQAIGDIIVTVIYGALLTVHFTLWAQWQRRGKKAAETPAIETSQFGRPLRRV
jgi:hypothetical protein